MPSAHQKKHPQTPTTKRAGRGPTMSDIARRAGISVPTVSYVLNGMARARHLSLATETRVLDIARELGYVRNGLARSLRRQRTTTISLIVSDLERGWANAIMKGMLETLDPAGYSVSLSLHFWDTERERREVERALEEQKAALVLRPMAENIDLYKRVLATGTPMVFLDRIDELPQTSSVMWDPAPAMRQIVAGLAGRGRRRIAYFGVDRGTREEKDRLEAFLLAMQQEAIPIHKDWLFLDRRMPLQEQGNQNPGRLVGYGGILADFLRNARSMPDALVCSCDALACLALTILRDDFSLRIPEDIAVTGLGDSGETPIIGLTSAFEPLHSLGESAGQLVLHLLAGDDPPAQSIHLATDIVHFRQTTPGITNTPTRKARK